MEGERSMLLCSYVAVIAGLCHGGAHKWQQQHLIMVWYGITTIYAVKTVPS